MTSDPTPGQWADLAPMAPEDQVASMATALARLAATDNDTRGAGIAALLEAEASLDDRSLATLSGSRLRALATLPTEDALALQAAWESAERARPGSEGMRRAVALQGACKGLSLEEVSRVEAFMPRVRELAGLAPARTHRSQDPPALVVDEPVRKGLLKRLFSRS